MAVCGSGLTLELEIMHQDRVRLHGACVLYIQA